MFKFKRDRESDLGASDKEISPKKSDQSKKNIILILKYICTTLSLLPFTISNYHLIINFIINL